MRIDTVMVGTLVATGVLAAVMTTGWNAGALGVTLLAMTSATAVVMWRYLSLRPDPGFTALDIALVAFMAWVILNTLLRDLPWVSSYQLSLLFLMPLGYLCMRCADSGTQRVILIAVMAVIGLIAVQSLVQVAFGQVPNVHFPNRNNQAALINIALVLAATAFLRSTGHRGIVILVLVALAAIAVGITTSRGATLGLIAGLALLLWKMPGVGWGRRGALATTVFTCLVAVNIMQTGTTTGRLATLAEPVTAGANRYNTWEFALQMIQEAPLLGHGLGLTHWVQAPKWSIVANQFGVFVHNDVLEFALMTGISGALLLVILALTAASPVLRTPAADDLRLAATAGLATVAVHSCFTFNLQLASLALLTGLLLGTVAGRADRIASFPAMRLPLRVVTPLAIIVLLAQGLILSLYGASMPFHRLPVHLHHTGAMELASTDASRQAGLRRAIMLQPKSTEARTLYASGLRLLAEQGDTVARAEAVRQLDRAIADNPHAYEAFYQRGRVTGRVEDYQAALAMNPKLFEARRLAAEKLVEVGRTEDAYRLLRDGLDHWIPRSRRVWPYLDRLADMAAERGEQDVVDRVNRRRQFRETDAFD